jgi:hypothetical protein
MRFTSVDPMAEKYYNISPYAYCANNPVNYIDPHGDTIVVNNTGYIMRNDNTDNFVYMSNKGQNMYLGELGGTININEIYTNLLGKSSSEAKSIWNPITFYDNVKTNGKWDLKNNKDYIYGLETESNTNFSYQGNDMESQDVGNHHFGVVAKAYGFFSEDFILRQAGKYQIKSNTSRPEWQIYTEETRTTVSPTGAVQMTKVKVMQPPYGDDPRDQRWIKVGFDYSKTRKK